jgi:hypothetical protein
MTELTFSESGRNCLLGSLLRKCSGKTSKLSKMTYVSVLLVIYVMVQLSLRKNKGLGGGEGWKNKNIVYIRKK